MIDTDIILEKYFYWIRDKIVGEDPALREYSRLLKQLFDIPFYYIPGSRDENRSADGLGLRKSFMEEFNVCPYDAIKKPCSVLEVMAALAIRCDDQIMWDDDIGSRASDWFFIMIDNLGLFNMRNESYDEKYVDYVIDSMMNHEYKQNGEGGLFITRDESFDMRNKEIWAQMCKYLTENDYRINSIISNLHYKLQKRG